MNKKGVESFPFFLFLSVLIAAFVLSISFYLLQNLSDAKAQTEIGDSYNSLKSAMTTLRDTGAQGSFTRIAFKVPAAYSVTFNTGNSTIHIKGTNLDLDNQPGFNLTYLRFDNKLNSGNYELVVYYGTHTQANDQPYALYFE